MAIGQVLLNLTVEWNEFPGRFYPHKRAPCTRLDRSRRQSLTMMATRSVTAGDRAAVGYPFTELKLRRDKSPFVGLKVAHLPDKSPPLLPNETRRFNTVFSRVRHWILSWVTWIQSPSTSLHSSSKIQFYIMLPSMPRCRKRSLSCICNIFRLFHLATRLKFLALITLITAKWKVRGKKLLSTEQGLRSRIRQQPNHEMKWTQCQTGV